MKLTQNRINFIKRKELANKDIVKFRESIDEYIEKNNNQPKSSDISFSLYNSLLEFDYGLNQRSKLIGELFGVKIKIDPTLKKNEIKFY